MRYLTLVLTIFSFSYAEGIVPQEKTLLPYKVVDKQDVSYLGTSRMVVRVMVDVEDIPTKAELKRIAEAIWTNGNTRWAEFTVFLYLPEMDIHSIAYGLGEYTPSGLKEFMIQDYVLYNTKSDPLKVKNMKVVEITSSVVNIRIGRSTDSKVICQAKKGETFRYVETIGNWYEIDMYSSDYRYIHKSTAIITEKTNKFPLTGSQKRRFVNELAKLEDKAARDSGGWESWTDQTIDRERELIDCYKLKLFRENGISTHLYGAIFE